MYIVEKLERLAISPKPITAIQLNWCTGGIPPNPKVTGSNPVADICKVAVSCWPRRRNSPRKAQKGTRSKFEQKETEITEIRLALFSPLTPVQLFFLCAFLCFSWLTIAGIGINFVLLDLSRVGPSELAFNHGFHGWARMASKL
jgi:hypothetical protein